MTQDQNYEEIGLTSTDWSNLHCHHGEDGAHGGIDDASGGEEMEGRGWGGEVACHMASTSHIRSPPWTV